MVEWRLAWIPAEVGRTWLDIPDAKRRWTLRNGRDEAGRVAFQ